MTYTHDAIRDHLLHPWQFQKPEGSFYKREIMDVWEDKPEPKPLPPVPLPPQEPLLLRVLRCIRAQNSAPQKKSC